MVKYENCAGDCLTPCYQHPLWDVTGPVIGEEVIFWERKIFVVL